MDYHYQVPGKEGEMEGRGREGRRKGEGSEKGGREEGRLTSGY